MAACCISAEVLLLCVFTICHAESLAMMGEAPAWLTKATAWVTGECSARTPDALLGSVALLSIPGFLMKQMVNIHQLVASVDVIVAIDSKVP